MERRKSSGSIDADALEAQGQSLGMKGSIWNMIFNAEQDGPDLMHMVKKEPQVLLKRDDVGASPLLLLALLTHVDIATQIIRCDKTGKRVCDQYVSSGKDLSPYEGENLLHIAIVNENIDFARLLLKENRSLLKHKAIGAFFRLDGKCPWGAFPLSFATATNQPDMVDLLLEYGADLFAEDDNGDTCLHVAVRTGMSEMYIKLAEVADDRHAKAHVDADHMKTLWRSCLQASVVANRREMFEVILERSKIVLWTYGPVTCSLYPLSIMDGTIGRDEGCDEDYGGEETKSVLNMVIENERFDILRTTVVSKLIDIKWKKFGKESFFNRLKIYIAFLGVFTAAIILPEIYPFEFSEADLEAGFVAALLKQNIVWWSRAICELVVLGAALAKLRIEGSELLEVGLLHHFWLCQGAQALENWSSALACTGILIAGCSRLYPVYWESLEECSLTVSVLALWIYLMWFFLGWRFTGPFVIMIVEIIKQDVACLCLIFAVILGGFASAFLILGDQQGFGGALGHLWSCSAVVFGDTELLAFTGKNHSTNDPFKVLKDNMSILLAFTFLFMIGIILLNLLIAKMGDTYSNVADTAEDSWKMEMARIIESMEREMEPKQRQEKFKTFWVQHGDDQSERFLQLEETDPNFWNTKSKQQRKSGVKPAAPKKTDVGRFCVPWI